MWSEGGWEQNQMARGAGCVGGNGKQGPILAVASITAMAGSCAIKDGMCRFTERAVGFKMG